MTTCNKAIRNFVLYILTLASILAIISSCYSNSDNSKPQSSISHFYQDSSREEIGTSSLDETVSYIDSSADELSNETSPGDLESSYESESSVESDISSESDTSPEFETSIEESQRPKKDNILYLTFDDGPHSKNTVKVLDILKKHNIKATFFIIGDCAKRYPKLVKRIYDEGHVIASHSMSHNYYRLYETVEDFEADLKKWEETIKTIIGKEPETHIFRFPGGSSTPYQYGPAEDIIKALKKQNYYMYDWTAANGDKWRDDMKPEETVDEYLKRLLLETVHYCDYKKKPCIILMHDSVNETVDMLDWALTELEDEGYSFDTLANLNKSYLFPHK
ncbi:MAG: polysaccharide deacetylase [Eubacteriales bacterium]|nr:polysaccharide deacetylase [Eubacteriales bacterium]MDD4475461.1 polysaccharide deacetylase [Eubacteriales bacterium]